MPAVQLPIGPEGSLLPAQSPASQGPAIGPMVERGHSAHDSDAATVRWLSNFIKEDHKIDSPHSAEAKARRQAVSMREINDRMIIMSGLAEQASTNNSACSYTRQATCHRPASPSGHIIPGPIDVVVLLLEVSALSELAQYTLGIRMFTASQTPAQLTVWCTPKMHRRH